jgi:hypothetical protein
VTASPLMVTVPEAFAQRSLFTCLSGYEAAQGAALMSVVLFPPLLPPLLLAITTMMMMTMITPAEVITNGVAATAYALSYMHAQPSLERAHLARSAAVPNQEPTATGLPNRAVGLT